MQPPEDTDRQIEASPPVSIEVLICDDQKLMRAGLKTLLQLESDITVVGEAEDGQAAIELYQQVRPDIVLLDIRMPNLNGVETTRRLKKVDPEVRILIVTTFDDDAYVFEALRAGALGYILKDVSGADLAAGVRTVAAGNALLGATIAEKVLQNVGEAAIEDSNRLLDEPLSERERDVLRAVARGLSNGEIGRELHLAEGTVKNYVSAILTKTGTRDRTEAAVRAQRLGLL